MKPTNRNLLDIRWVQEVLIFFVLFILITLNAWHPVDNFADLAKAVIYFLILYVHVQLHRFVLVPALFQKHKYGLYFFFTGLLILFFSALLYSSDVYWIYYSVRSVRQDRFDVYFYHIGTCSLSLIAMLSPFLVLGFYQEQKKRSAEQISMSQMELKNLTAQLNPHFLFNTFNNLYGISLEEPSRVPDLILQISKLMRYQLESSARSEVALENELGFIESYLELEEERVGQRCDIKYEFENAGPGEQYFIVPLLLISFIENAFKHGTRSIASNFVYIKIFVKNVVLAMEIVNSVPSGNNQSEYSMGIGLNNTVQRLNILYAERYKLEISPGPEKYTTRLTLPLTVKKNG